jgi:hypothetical protein
MTAADRAEECRRLFERQRAIDLFCRGELPADVLFDLLAEDQIDPFDWADNALGNVELDLGVL